VSSILIGILPSEMSFIGHTASLKHNFELSIHVSYLCIKEVKGN